MASAQRPEYESIYEAAFHFPAIDNHAHPLLRSQHRNHKDIPFEGVISEAHGETLKDAVYTLSHYRAVSQLSELFHLKDGTWDDIVATRASLDYVDLCKKCFDPSRIQCILLDDGLGVPDLAEDYTWHDQFTVDPSRRIVRVEIAAEAILNDILKQASNPGSGGDSANILDTFSRRFKESLTASANDKDVVAFKSIICYRSGLDVSTSDAGLVGTTLIGILETMFGEQGRIRLDARSKVLNDYIVRTTLEIAATCKKPVQFHTGLGDNDINLVSASPAHLQPIIKAYPDTIIVLLHAAYPYTREAGYLTAVYHNVYLDFGEIFPFVSATGQKDSIKQVFELSPTNKILWSTDGHWWPESYYLATIQSRQTLYQVLKEAVQSSQLTESQAIEVVQNALFHNANRIYRLGLEPIKRSR